jgi:hypothetical protein
MSKKVICPCKEYEGVYTVIYEPGNRESIVKCNDCGKLWYSLLFEQVNFTFSGDEFEEYQIPLTMADYQKIKKTRYKDLNLNFLTGRSARIIFTKGEIEISSDFALGKCKRLSYPDNDQ